MLLIHVVQEQADDREYGRSEGDVRVGRADHAHDTLSDVNALVTEVIVVHVGWVDEGREGHASGVIA